MQAIKKWKEELGLTGVELLLVVAVGAAMLTMFAVLVGGEIAK